MATAEPRAARKWFLAEKLGPKAWFVRSEKQYYQQHATYYERSVRSGWNFPTLDYSQALPFLLLLQGGVGG